MHESFLDKDSQIIDDAITSQEDLDNTARTADMRKQLDFALMLSSGAQSDYKSSQAYIQVHEHHLMHTGQKRIGLEKGRQNVLIVEQPEYASGELTVKYESNGH